MDFRDYLDDAREEGRVEGLKEGRAEGLKEGRQEGRREECANTEREKARADRFEAELEKYKEKYGELV